MNNKVEKQLAMFNDSMKWKKILETAGVPVKVLISRTSQLYYTVQNIKNRILNRQTDTLKALPAGITAKTMEGHRKFVEQLAVGKEEINEEKAIKQAEIKAQEQAQELEEEPEIAE